MTFDEAMTQARDHGQRVTHAGMGDGWTIFYHPKTDGMYCLNPHTGGDYAFRPSEADKAADWTAR